MSPLAKAVVNLSNIKASFTDHDGVDEAVRVSGTDWTLARAVALTDKPARGPLRAGDAGSDKPGSRINRADLAGFLLDAIEKGTWIHQAPLVWNARG
jgi:hypothetical protein